MFKTADELTRIAAAGGGFILDAKNRTADELARIAAAGSSKRIHLVLKNVEGKTDDELVRIAVAGQGCVFFDTTF